MEARLGSSKLRVTSSDRRIGSYGLESFGSHRDAVQRKQASKLAEANVLLSKAHAVQMELHCRFNAESMRVPIRKVLRLPRFFNPLSSAALNKDLEEIETVFGDIWQRLASALAGRCGAIIETFVCLSRTQWSDSVNSLSENDCVCRW